MITTLTEKNQVAVPAKLVRELNLQPGIQLDWSIGDDGSLVVRPLLPRAELANRALGMGKDWVREGEDPIADLIRERVQDDVHYDASTESLSRAELVDKLAGMGRAWLKEGEDPVADLIRERRQGDIGEDLPLSNLSRAELANLAFGMGEDWVHEGGDPIADLIRERVQDDIDKELW